MTSNHLPGPNLNDNASEASTTTTWGNDWPQVGISRSQLYNGIVKAGYESNSYIEVGDVIKSLMEWRDLSVNELEQRITNSADPNILPDPVLNQSLRKLLSKVRQFCDRHLQGLRQRVQQLRSEDTVVLDLLDLADDEEQNVSPPAPLRFDASYSTTLLDTPNIEAVPSNPLPRQNSQVGTSTPLTSSRPQPNWPVSAMKTTQASDPVTSAAPTSSVETLDGWAERLLEQIYNYHKNIHDQLALTGQFSPSTLTRYVTSTLIQAVPPPDVVERMINHPTAEYDLGDEIRNIQGNVRRLDLLRTKLNEMACRRRHVASPQEKDIVESMGIAIEQELEKVMLVLDRLEEMVKAAVGQTRFDEMVSYLLPNFHESIAATVGRAISSPNGSPVSSPAVTLTVTPATASTGPTHPKVRFDPKVSANPSQPPVISTSVAASGPPPVVTTGVTTVVPSAAPNTLAPPVVSTRSVGLSVAATPNTFSRPFTWSTPVFSTVPTQSHTIIPHPRPPVAQVSSGQTQHRMPAPIQANPMFTLGQQSVPSTFRHATPTVVQSTPTTQTVVPPTPAPQPPVVVAQVAPTYTRPLPPKLLNSTAVLSTRLSG